VRPRFGTVAVLLLVVATMLGGCVTPNSRWVSPRSGVPGSPTPSTSSSVGPITWSPCQELFRTVLGRDFPNVKLECGSVKVPQDWTAPDAGTAAYQGATFDIAVVRGRATGQRDRIGSLLINPGGPGASGLEYGVYRSVTLPAEVTRRFDVIGFDPRGVGRSATVKCFSDADLDANFGGDPDPVSQADFDASVSLARRLAQACGDKYGDALRLYSTEQTARDMDALRVALGDEKLSYLGYSYGTLLGAVYAQLFPKNVRALALDGAVDPTQTSVTSAENQAKGFERAFDNFAAWCQRNAADCPIAPNARAAVIAALQSGRTSPVRGGDGRMATAGWIFTAIIASLYDESYWRPLAMAVNGLKQGRAGGVFQLADGYLSRDQAGHYSNLFDVNATVNCTDDEKTPTVEQIRTLQDQWRAKYPLFGASMALNLICAQWPGKRDPYPVGPAIGAPPIVVVGTLGDPATPYEQTAALANVLGVGVVVTWQGEGHGAYPQTTCVTEAVNRYLIDLRVPAANLVCPR
jgi:pimeloyl-ACP methyl ester carboxylesterase